LYGCIGCCFPTKVLEEKSAAIFVFRQKAVSLHRVSPIRPAPFELPQGLTAARVEGCSGAI